MSEQAKVQIQLLDEEKPIDTVVNTVIRRQNSGKNIPTQSYKHLYSSIKNILKGFDSSVSECKKYNEAKIHRKYEIIIGDLENQISILKDQIKEEQKARNPSKKYVEQLVDQLVNYKNQNEKLRQENAQLSKYKTENPERMDLMSSRFQQKQKNQEKPHFHLRLEIEDYLEQKKNSKRNHEEMKSKFQIFLFKNKQRTEFMTFNDLLTEIDEWIAEFSQRNQTKKAEKLRSNVLSTMADEEYHNKFPKLESPFSLPAMSNRKHHNKSNIERSSRRNIKTIEVVNKRNQKYCLK